MDNLPALNFFEGLSLFPLIRDAHVVCIFFVSVTWFVVYGVLDH